MLRLCCAAFAIPVLALCAGEATAREMSFAYGDGYQSPAENIYKSQIYDWRLSTDRGFRRVRMRKECGPINLRSLRADCLGSFDTFEPTRPGYDWHHGRRH